MTSLDTNLLVRAIMRDDQHQFPIAIKLLAQPALVVPTVLLELVWVLGSSRRMARADIAGAL
ncbi:MAG: VapC toxin family PIN domain ribonuclease, partial [Sphingomonadaceae bacterium]|nr:VapC toxin family PIN domain ribonuclease [Sphingomonadaceae bacterium]